MTKNKLTKIRHCCCVCCSGELFSKQDHWSTPGQKWRHPELNILLHNFMSHQTISVAQLIHCQLFSKQCGQLFLIIFDCSFKTHRILFPMTIYVSNLSKERGSSLLWRENKSNLFALFCNPWLRGYSFFFSGTPQTAKTKKQGWKRAFDDKLIELLIQI